MEFNRLAFARRFFCEVDMLPSADKPWAKLRMSRKTYEAHRLWKQCKLDRKTFDALVLTLPEEFVEQAYEEAHAEKLVEALFGKFNLLKRIAKTAPKRWDKLAAFRF